MLDDQPTTGSYRYLSTRGAPFAIMGTSNLLPLYRLASSKHGFCPAGTDSALGRVYAALQPDLPPPSPGDRKHASSSCAADRALQAARCRIRSTVLLPVYDLRAAAALLGPGPDPRAALTAEQASAAVLPSAVFELASHEPLMDFDAAVDKLNAALAPEDLAVPRLCAAQAVAGEAQQLGDLPALDEEDGAEDSQGDSDDAADDAAGAGQQRARRQSAPAREWSGSFAAAAAARRRRR
ncbi:hypothetical protein MNEG_12053 [Monoraphidium neglectum]|uniref:Uncharacterized protein n=1 Tax=Monoraphidium neglectum TaxID=145388 RepID=A0A0D2M3H4_9CHLO|nr:hypothetical protein MNEG_12053 [Monoraphidium neglectum]KIY95911.1 hypothetical protein MNEG_12053 [Monoraphidium neglectum]|eukprot:XP_013894931.1 hypothetical protein MNEG_12053 [Monoraphidium neglectum]